MKKPKAIALFSGGLDSILAAKLMLEQGIEIHALTFITPFSEFSKLGRNIPARVFARKLNIPITVKFLGSEFIELVQHPSHGYGKHLNPCIDCRIMLMQRAKLFMEQMGADFIITGEVVGERPMTQHKQAMKLTETKSGLTGLLVRPLSGKLLEPTIPEQQGIIQRAYLMEIAGRSRKPQMALAKKFGIEDYPTPAGGCLLTDPVFSLKLKDALEHGENTSRDMAMLGFGRHFRLPSGAKLVVGRNEGENKKILASQTRDSLCFDAYEIPSPIALIRNVRDETDIATAAATCLRYSDSDADEGTVDYWVIGRVKKSIVVRKIGDTELDKLRIQG
jgi:tRNA U34 2-thiouridine synthase MnmA/TrmU